MSRLVASSRGTSSGQAFWKWLPSLWSVGGVLASLALLSACRPESGAPGSAARSNEAGVGQAGSSSVAGMPSAAPSGCPLIPGSPWVPEAGVGLRNSVSRQSQEWVFTAPILGAAQGIYSAAEIEFSFTLPDDLGPEGSLVLSAQVQNVPGVMASEVTPVLISLHDGEEEFIKLPRSGAAGDCSRAGFYVVAANDRLSRNSNCRLQSGSAYADDTAWWRAQDLANDRALSVNTFPTCRFSEGEAGCAFTTERLGAQGRLRFGRGVTYRGKYVLLARRYQNIPEQSLFANLKLTLVKKSKKPEFEGKGRVNIDLVLVGSENIRASRTARGSRNLQTLLGLVQKHFAQTHSSIQFGRVRAVEWGCAEWGDLFARTPINTLPQLFRQGSLLVSQLLGESSERTDAVRIFLVSGLESEDDGRTFLGIAGALGGPPIVGTGASGVAFATFGTLASANPACELVVSGERECPLGTLEASFVDLASTMSHELGHFLGLSHLSESSAIVRDPLPDTPACTMLERRGAVDVLTARSCSQDSNLFTPTGRSCQEVCPNYDGVTQFCSEAPECEFNHVMWWTAKGFDPQQKAGDGNLFSKDSGAQLRLSPWVD